MSTLQTSAVEVLQAGQTLLDFAHREDQALSALSGLMEPPVIDELRAEHDEIGRDLELLEWILSTTPDSPDASALAESLARRMHTHVSRDGRLLARALGLSARS